MPKKARRLENFNPFKDRTPIQRSHAAQYLLLTLLSFAFSVSGTRLFLELTGYPKLGGGGVHIAHVLWGGLFLFAAALLPLILVNQWALRISALSAGLGIGLFIDEVGKFITQTNDYFHPAAAPIVYVFFLFTVLLFSQIRKSRKSSSRGEMYKILEHFGEVLDHDLSPDEYNDLTIKLDLVISTAETKALGELAENLKHYLETNRKRVVPEDPTIFERARKWIIQFEKRTMHQKRLRFIIVVGLFTWAAWTFISPVNYLFFSVDQERAQPLLADLITNHLVSTEGGFNWPGITALIESLAGALALISAGLIALNALRKGVWLGITVLLFILTVVNPLIFYFEQFSTIIIATLQFLLFVLLIRFKQRFLAANVVTSSAIPA